MTRLMAMAAVLGLFAVGVLTGGFSVHLYQAHDERGPGPRGERPARFMERLNRELELSPDQRGQLEQILHSSFTEGEALRREFLPRVREQLDATREKILAVLTPKQQVKFDEMHRRHRGMAERFLLGRGHRPPGGPERHRPPPPHRGD